MKGSQRKLIVPLKRYLISFSQITCYIHIWATPRQNHRLKESRNDVKLEIDWQCLWNVRLYGKKVYEYFIEDLLMTQFCIQQHWQDLHKEKHIVQFSTNFKIWRNSLKSLIVHCQSHILTYHNNRSTIRW